MIFAELVKEDGGEHGYFTLRYCVWNGDNMLGTYGVHYKPWDHAHSVPYGASRDYHRPATEKEITLRAEWDAFHKLPEAEQDARYDANTEPDYGYGVDTCCYFDNQPCVCDGSGLVEVTEDPRKAFMIAAMMADIPSRECPVHEHDCDTCTYIGSYRLKHPYTDDDEGWRTGTPGKRVEVADVYLACDNSGYKYIVRYGKWGEYATTNTVSHYALAPMVDGEDPNYNRYFIFDNANDPLEELSEDIFTEDN
jgi:hypothetical protein